VSIVSHWGRVVVMEALAGNHLVHMQDAFKFSFSLFLLREGIFFMAIFWVYLDAALNPTIEIGAQWPPVGILPINPFGIPLLNTVVLLRRGVTATYSHYILLRGLYALPSLIVTIGLAFVFEYLQYLEYRRSTFSIRDGVYGRIFFFGTGFHGLHVIFGHTLLFVNRLRIYWCHYTRTRHILFELRLLYWHFVDVVWVLLYVLFYWWVY
jgi:cytochrome c oxidase subunit 3